MKQKQSQKRVSDQNIDLIAQKFKEDGNDAFMKSQYEKAIELYSKAIELDSNNCIYFNNRSQAYFYLFQFQNALNDSNKSIELNPNYIKALNNKAQILLELGLEQDAIQLLSNTQQQNPNEITNQLLLKLRNEQSQYQTLSENDPEFQKHNQLIEWLQQGKAEFPKLQIKYYSRDYRGVHTIQKVKAHETILFVPLDHLITLEIAKDSSVAKKILAYKLDLLSPKHSYLSTFLLQEKYNPDSFWRPYINILPDSYSNFPIFFNEEDLKLLTGSPFLKQVREKLQDLHRDYDDICMVAPEFNRYGFQQFCWARMTASSRIFGITINGLKTDAFVPLADMLNHRRPKQTTWMYSDERGGFIIETDEDIDRAQMVFDSYGRKCNSRFLLNYGFIVEDNDANEVAVNVYINRGDPLIRQKEEMLGEALPEMRIFRILADAEEPNVFEFQGYIRFLMIQDLRHLILLQNIQLQQQNSADRVSNYKPIKTPPTSIEVEILMWKKIHELCSQQLSQYPTSLEDDLNLLKSELTTNQKNCILLRSGEKQILLFHIEMGEKMIKLLTISNKKELSRFLIKQSNQIYMPYVNKVVLPLLSKRETENKQ